MNKIAWICTETGAWNDDMPIAAKKEKATILMSAITIAVITKNRSSVAKTDRLAITEVIYFPLSITLTDVA